MTRFILLATLFLFSYAEMNAFCGFYVAKADAKLFNKSSQVIMVRDGDHTVITMSNDYQGSVKDFAMVVPVPVVLQESDIRIVQQYVFDKLDAYTAPRMVEYYDHNPCQTYALEKLSTARPRSAMRSKDMALDDFEEEKETGVTIEAKYTVGEYDILILSAKESGGLKTWLTSNGYKIPANAEEVLQPYIADKMKFFVVKVNLDQQQLTGSQTLRPLQIQFNSNRFMLPIRLGMANATSEQDLVIYAFTRSGRVETANYRTTKLPTDREIPTFVKSRGLFGPFYKDLYGKAWKNEGRNSVMLEYSWDVSATQPVKCDPCVTPPITFAELREAGVWWVQPTRSNGNYTGQLYVTRLHARYSRSTFPQDLMFMITPNKKNFQGRYIVRHPATGPMDCEAGKKYKKQLSHRKRRELQELVALTGWDSYKYHWYLGDGTAPPVNTDPQPDVQPDILIGEVTPQPKPAPLPEEKPVYSPAPSQLGNTVADVQPVANVTGKAQADTDTAAAEAQMIEEGDAFLARAIESDKDGGIPKQSLLFGMALLMFAGGMTYRIIDSRKAKKEDA